MANIQLETQLSQQQPALFVILWFESNDAVRVPTAGTGSRGCEGVLV